MLKVPRSGVYLGDNYWKANSPGKEVETLTPRRVVAVRGKGPEVTDRRIRLVKLCWYISDTEKVKSAAHLTSGETSIGNDLFMQITVNERNHLSQWQTYMHIYWLNNQWLFCFCSSFFKCNSRLVRFCTQWKQCHEVHTWSLTSLIVLLFEVHLNFLIIVSKLFRISCSPCDEWWHFLANI